MKKIEGLLIVLCSVLTLQAQDIKSVFIALPDSLSPLLTKVNREDFGDFLASGMKAEVKNRFGRSAEMVKMTTDYLLLEPTESSRVEMKLLPLSDSVKVMCVVHTYLGPLEDSKVDFYTTDWKRLDAADFLTLPAEDDFYAVPATESLADSLAGLKKYADMYLLKASLSEKDAVIRFDYMTPSYMEKEKAGQLKQFLKEQPLCYEWKNGKFVKKDSL